MNDHDWLTLQRPDVPAPSGVATDAARTALLRHARRRPFWQRGRMLVLGAVAACAAMAIVVAGGSVPVERGAGGAGGSVAVAAPLPALAAELVAAPAPTGNATLVRHRNRFPDGRSFTGNDLYTDAGKYFYGATMAEMKAALDADQTTDSGTSGAILRAATASADGTAAEARRRILEAFPLPEGKAPAMPAKAKKANVKPISHAEQVDNWLWIHCLDALTAGAGRADIRAGAMLALSTIPTVTAKETEFHGTPVLAVTNADLTDRYQETLMLGARTGVLVHFRGEMAGGPVGVDIDYDITRVTVADLR